MAPSPSVSHLAKKCNDGNLVVTRRQIQDGSSNNSNLRQMNRDFTSVQLIAAVKAPHTRQQELLPAVVKRTSAVDSRAKMAVCLSEGGESEH